MSKMKCSLKNNDWEDLPWEDVYVTGLLAGIALGSRLIHASRFSSSRQHYTQPEDIIIKLSNRVPSSLVFNEDPNSVFTINSIEDRGKHSINSESIITHSIWKCLNVLSFRSDSMTLSLWNRTYTC